MFGFRDIDIIRGVVQAGWFRVAADELGWEQSAISRRIHDLRRRTGPTLFAREEHGVWLPAAGRLFLEQAERLLTRRDRIPAEMARAPGLSGNSLDGVAETMTPIIPPMLTRLHESSP